MLLVALLLQATDARPPAEAPLPPLHGGPAPIVCPIGGERFETWQPRMYSTMGARPDGKPYSYLPFPFPLPVCPSNRLVIFDRFSASDTAQLAPLIATPGYRRLADSEVPHYVGYWLATQLKRPVEQRLDLLLQAIWAVSPGQEAARATPRTEAQMRRYQTLFVRIAEKLDHDTPAGERLWIQARAANAARQLGRFDAADRLRRAALATLASAPDAGQWNTYLTSLGAAIARRDTDVEPLDMIPDRERPFVCARRTSLNGFDRAICEEPETAATVARLRAHTR